MKKAIAITSIVAIGALSFAAYFHYHSDNSKTESISHQHSSVNGQTDSMGIVPSNWKTYSSDRFGISFQYPTTWIKSGNDAEVVDISGALTAVEGNFIDTASKTTFKITLHLPPNGIELYKYAISQYDSSRGNKQIRIAGSNAIQVSNILSIDGKGHTINPPLRSIVVHFLDKNKTGEIELHFSTSVNNEDSEIVKFNQLLSTFVFN